MKSSGWLERSNDKDYGCETVKKLEWSRKSDNSDSQKGDREWEKNRYKDWDGKIRYEDRDGYEDLHGSKFKVLMTRVQQKKKNTIGHEWVDIQILMSTVQPGITVDLEDGHIEPERGSRGPTDKVWKRREEFKVCEGRDSSER